MAQNQNRKIYIRQYCFSRSGNYFLSTNNLDDHYSIVIKYATSASKLHLYIRYIAVHEPATYLLRQPLNYIRCKLTEYTLAMALNDFEYFYPSNTQQKLI